MAFLSFKWLLLIKYQSLKSRLWVNRPFVRLSVCPYVTLFPSRFLFCNNSSSTDAIEMKLYMWIELKRVKSHAWGSEGCGFDPQPRHTKSRKKMVQVAPLLTLGIER